MEVIKIVFFVCAIVSLVYPSKSTNILHDDSSLIKDNCLCYPKSQDYTTVPELIDLQNNGLERLVVYIYKDVKTNDIKVYIPNVKKQSIIPDLSFEIGDGLTTVNKETIIELYEKTPNRIDVVNKMNDNVEHPTGMNVEHTKDISITTIPNTGVHVHNKPPKDSLVVEDDSNMWSGMNSADIHEPTQHSPWQPPREQSYWDMNSEIPDEIYKFVELYNSKGNIKHSSEILTPEYFMNTYMKFPISADTHLTFDKWFTKQMSNFQNVNLPSDINSINMATLRYLVQKILQQNNMYVATDGTLIDAHGTALDVSKLELRPMLLGNAVEYIPSADNLKLPKDLPYLEGILVTLVYPPKVLGLIPLGKTYLYQTSTPKGMGVAGTKLTGMKIAKHSISRIVPGIINKETHDIDVNKKTLPTVTFVNESPKKVYIPIPKEEISKGPLIKHEIAPGNSKKKTSKKNVRKDVKSKSKGNLGNSWNGVDSSAEVKDKSGSIADDSRKIPIMGELIEKLVTLLGKSKRRHNDSESGEDYENINGDFEDKPDFRIIGGNAATSSGAPVSNKGRSGEHIDSPWLM